MPTQIPIRTVENDARDWIVYTVVNGQPVVKDGPYSDKGWAVNRAKNIVQNNELKGIDVPYEIHVVPYVKKPY